MACLIPQDKLNKGYRPAVKQSDKRFFSVTQQTPNVVDAQRERHFYSHEHSVAAAAGVSQHEPVAHFLAELQPNDLLLTTPPTAAHLPS